MRAMVMLALTRFETQLGGVANESAQRIQAAALADELLSAMEKMVSPCWIAFTRRVANDPPSRRRSTIKTVGALASPGRRK